MERSFFDPDEISLGEAFTQARRRFPEFEPGEIDHALMAAFHDERIRTTGRSEKWFRNDFRNDIGGLPWDPDRLVIVRPDLDAFEFELWGERYLVTHVRVHRQDVERLLGLVDKTESPPARTKALPTLVDESGERGDRSEHAPKTPKRRGRRPDVTRRVVEAMRTAIAEGRHTTQSIQDCTEESLATEFGVSRTTIRSARDEVLTSSAKGNN